MDLVPDMHKVKCPLMFIASHNDSMTGNHHSEQLYKACESEKIIEYISQGHNDRRSASTLMSVVQFLRKCSDKPKSRLFLQK